MAHGRRFLSLGTWLLAIAIAGCASPPTPTGVQSASTSPAPLSGWRTLPPAPIAGRTDYAAAWTGTEAIVWGGISSGPRGSGDFVTQADGAAFNPTTNTWRILSAAPLAARAGASGVWIADTLYVWGGINGASGRALGDGAAYEPTTDSWRVLPDSPFHEERRTGQLAVAAGARLAVVSLGAELAIAFYDPSTDRWTEAPSPPLPGSFITTAAWTGTDLILVVYPSGEAARAIAAAYKPGASEWRVLADSPLAASGAPPALWTGSTVIALSPGASAQPLASSAAYEPATDRWRGLRNDGPCTTADGRWTGTTVLSPGSMYEPSSQVCRPLPDPPLRPGGREGREGANPIWTGDELIVWSGSTGQLGTEIGADGVAFRP